MFDVHKAVNRSFATPDTSHFKRVGARMGYNEGGTFLDPASNEKHYIKSSHEDHVKTEYAAGKIYNHLGIKTLNPQIVKHKGKTSLASPWQEGLHPIHDYSDPAHRAQLADHLVVGAITMNHDAIGGYDNPPNISYDRHNDIVMHDPGGSLGYGGIGSPKHFGPEATEIDSLRNPQYAAGRAFQHVTDDDVKQSLDRILPKWDAGHVADTLKNAGVKNHEKKAKTLNDRVEWLKSYRNRMDK